MLTRLLLPIFVLLGATVFAAPKNGHERREEGGLEKDRVALKELIAVCEDGDAARARAVRRGA